MLRRRLGDERFLKMLAEFRRRYEFRVASTADLRALVKEFLPPRVSPSSVDGYFENWVYSTGIPALKLNYSVKGAAFLPEKPRVWFGKQLANIGLGGTFDLAPDGKRLAVVFPPASAEPREVRSHVTLVTNFFDEVRWRVAGQVK